MNEAWFAPELAPWFSMLSLLSLLAYLQTYALKGKHRATVLGAYQACTVGAGLIVLVGAAAWLVGQPPWVWGTLVFAGGLTCVLMIYSTRRVAHMYKDAELRKSIAQDL